MSFTFGRVCAVLGLGSEVSFILVRATPAGRAAFVLRGLWYANDVTMPSERYERCAAIELRPLPEFGSTLTRTQCWSGRIYIVPFIWEDEEFFQARGRACVRKVPAVVELAAPVRPSLTGAPPSGTGSRQFLGCRRSEGGRRIPRIHGGSLLSHRRAKSRRGRKLLILIGIPSLLLFYFITRESLVSRRCRGRLIEFRSDGLGRA